MARIRLEEVSKSFGGSPPVLNGLSLEVRDQEYLVLLGASGCGKTTCLRLIAGLERPTAGRIWLDHQLVNEVAPERRNVAMAFQDPTLYPQWSVAQNLRQAGRALRIAGHPLRVASEPLRVASSLHLEHLLERRPGDLSGGERQRVALGRTVLQSRAAWLLDEPLAHVDGPLRLEIRTWLKTEQRRRGITTVHVTHDPTEAVALGDRIAVLEQGRVVQVDTPDALSARPATRAVVAILGEKVFGG